MIKVFGKVLVFGGYAILEPGNVGLVVNIGKGIASEISKRSDSKVRIRNTDYRIDTWSDPSGLPGFAGRAAYYTYRYLEMQGKHSNGLDIELKNDPEMGDISHKPGFGSSAASTVAVVASILHAHGIDIFSNEGREKVFLISFYSHSEVQGGRGSGFDIAACCFGSQFYRRSLDTSLPFEDFVRCSFSPELFNVPPWLDLSFHDTGQQASTRDMVAKVLKLAGSPAYEVKMKEYSSVNEELRTILLGLSNDKIGSFAQMLERSWSLRRELCLLAGVETEPAGAREAVKHHKLLGASAAGFCGAGGGDCIAVIDGTPGLRSCSRSYSLTKFL